MAFTNYHTVTIDKTKVPSTQTGFPVLFKSPVGTVNTGGTAVTLATGDAFPSWLQGNNILINAVVYAVTTWVSGTSLTLSSTAGTQTGVAYCGTPDFRTTGNSGHVANANGYDLRTFSNSSLTTAIDFQLEKYVATTGELVMWVYIASLSSSVNSVYYIGYGDAALSSNASSTTTWNSNYKVVLHLGNGTMLSAADSTANANNGTLVNTPVAATGKIDGCGDFEKSSTQYISLASPVDIDAFTYSCWINQESFAGGGSDVQAYLGEYGGGGAIEQVLFVFSNGKLGYFGTFLNGTIPLDVGTGPSTLSLSTWYYLVASYDSSAGLKVYLNATVELSAAAKGTATNGAAFTFATESFNVTNRAYDGLMDECRISDIARSADWITAEYNNQGSPDTFFSVDVEQSVGGGGSTLTINVAD